MSPLMRRARRFAEQSARSSVDARVTISARVARLARPSLDNGPEAARMIEEKIVAAFEGTAHASLVWGEFLFSSALRGGASTAQLSYALFDVAEAALRPARRAVRDNARRLTKHGGKR